MIKDISGKNGFPHPRGHFCHVKDQKGPAFTEALTSEKHKYFYFRTWCFMTLSVMCGRVVKKILSKEGGVGVALEILQMRFYDKDKEISKFSNDLMKVSREVMMAYSFEEERKGGIPDYELAQVVDICLDGTQGRYAATIMCQSFKEAILKGHATTFGFKLLPSSLSKVQPAIFMDTFLDEDIEDYLIQGMFHDGADWHDNPLDQVSAIDLLAWCEKDPSSRYALVASAVKPFKFRPNRKYEGIFCFIF